MKTLAAVSDPTKWLSFLPHHIHSSCSDLGVAAHDGHTGSERAVNTEHNKLSSPRNNSEITVCKGMVTSVREGSRETQSRCKYIDLQIKTYLGW